MRPTVEEWAMNLALTTSLRSTCLRRNVGAVLLNSKNNVIGIGYNGVPAGQKHCNEECNGKYPNSCSGARSKSGTNLDGCEAIHAEQNALLQCKDIYDIFTIYTTVSPCLTCVKMLLNTSCQRIVFDEQYPHTESKTLWTKNNREWIHVKETRNRSFLV